MHLDIFQEDPNFLENEQKYEELKKSILGKESKDDEARSDEGSEVEDEEDEEQMEIEDETGTNLVNLRRTIYLTIMTCVDFEEAGHKLLKIKLEPGQEVGITVTHFILFYILCHYILLVMCWFYFLSLDMLKWFYFVNCVHLFPAIIVCSGAYHI